MDRPGGVIVFFDGSCGLCHGLVRFLLARDRARWFRFAALDFRDPASNQFAYKLEGFDKDWKYFANRDFATYTNLPGGGYTFRVKAANNDGYWNEKGAALSTNDILCLVKA